jgi:hypothetical protein
LLARVFFVYIGCVSEFIESLKTRKKNLTSVKIKKILDNEFFFLHLCGVLND